MADTHDRVEILLDAYGSYKAVLQALKREEAKLESLKARLMNGGEDLLMVAENEQIALNLIGSRIVENQQRVAQELQAEHLEP